MSIITLLINSVIIAKPFFFSPILKFKVGKGSCPCSHREDVATGYLLETEGFGKGRGKCI